MAIHHGSRHGPAGMRADPLALEASLVATVAPLMRRLRTAVRSSADWGGLTFADYGVLDLLGRCGPLRQRDIGRHLGVTAPVVTRLINGLTDAKLVRRAANPDDGRSNLVALTPGGTRRGRAMHTDVLAAATRLLEPLASDTRVRIRLALDELQVLVPHASRDVIPG